jgi:hypothetical protein
MGKQYNQRPSALVGVSDAYAAFCFDEAVYLYGIFVEASIHKATAGVTDPKKAEQQRNQTLNMLLSQDDIPEPKDATGASAEKFVHDPDDPVPIELARTLPPAVKFTNRKFADPADFPAFKKNKKE